MSVDDTEHVDQFEVDLLVCLEFFIEENSLLVLSWTMKPIKLLKNI